MKWLIHLIVNSIVLMVVAGYLDSFYLSGIGAAFVASILLSILNVIVKPILVLLTLPVTVLTLGLFLLIINGITLMIAQALMGDAFVVDGFGAAILAAIIISLLNLLIQKFVVERFIEK